MPSRSASRSRRRVRRRRRIRRTASSSGPDAIGRMARSAALLSRQARPSRSTRRQRSPARQACSGWHRPDRSCPRCGPGCCSSQPLQSANNGALCSCADRQPRIGRLAADRRLDRIQCRDALQRLMRQRRLSRRRARRRTCAAHAPSTPPRSRRGHTGRHNPHSRPPAGCRGTVRGAGCGCSPLRSGL